MLPAKWDAAPLRRAYQLAATRSVSGTASPCTRRKDGVYRNTVDTDFSLAAKFPWKAHTTFVDVGPAQGMIPVTLARAHSHLRGIGFDLPPVQPAFEEFVANNGLSDRVRFQAGDFLQALCQMRMSSLWATFCMVGM